MTNHVEDLNQDLKTIEFQQDNSKQGYSPDLSCLVRSVRLHMLVERLEQVHQKHIMKGGESWHHQSRLSSQEMLSSNFSFNKIAMPMYF